jgi:hypothetical protein
MYMCGMPTDRAVDHSAALIVIRYSRTRAVYVTIFIVITTLRTRQLEMSRPAVILIVQLFEVYEGAACALFIIHFNIIFEIRLML